LTSITAEQEQSRGGDVAIPWSNQQALIELSFASLRCIVYNWRHENFLVHPRIAT